MGYLGLAWLSHLVRENQRGPIGAINRERRVGRQFILWPKYASNPIIGNANSKHHCIAVTIMNSKKKSLFYSSLIPLIQVPEFWALEIPSHICKVFIEVW